MASFHLPTLNDNADGSWGPSTSTVPKFFQEVPYALHSKADKINHIADWAAESTSAEQGAAGGRQTRTGARGGRRHEAYGGGANGAPNAFGYVHDEDEKSFSLVDSGRAAAGASRGRGSGLFQNRGRGRGAPRGGAGFRGGRGGFQAGGAGGRTDGRPERGGWGTYRGRGRGGYGGWDKPQRVRDWSITIGSEWQMLEEITFTRLQKLSLNVQEPEDLSIHGTIYSYNKTFDAVNTRSERPLEVMEMVKYNTTTSDDPIIHSLAEKNEATIYTTDAILSVLMTATRSVNSWDIVIVKDGDNLYLDKREGGPFDFVTVNENAADPPAETDKADSINSPSSLSLEATYINTNFASQVVNLEKRKAFSNPNPFYSPEVTEPLASCAYRYRKFDLSLNSEQEEESKVKMVVRTEVDAYQTKKDSYVNIRALNEFDSRAQGSGKAPDWRSKLDASRGAVVATEMKNNSAKLARWAVQSVLSGAETMKLGFISRQNAKDPHRHTILGVQSHKPKDFASQMAVSLANGWGIVRMIVDLCMKQPEGKYVLVKDPNNPLVRFYAVPADALEALEEEEEEEEDEENADL